MDIVVKGRKAEVSDRFRTHAIEKLGKLERLDHRIMRLEVEVSEARNPRQSDVRQRVEVTCFSKGPVIRAEAAAQDCYAALESAVDKLEERLRRAADKRRVHHGVRTPASLGRQSAAMPSLNGSRPAPDPGADAESDDASAAALAGGDAADEGPFVVREKYFEAPPMTLDDALLQMELVGHDFFLFGDADTGLPSVVYRRKGYDYGVIRLKHEGLVTAAERTGAAGGPPGEEDV